MSGRTFAILLIALGGVALATDRGIPTGDLKEPLFKVYHHKADWGAFHNGFRFVPKTIHIQTETQIDNDSERLTDDQIKAEYKRLHLIPPVYKGYKRIEVRQFDVIRARNIIVIYVARDLLLD